MTSKKYAERNSVKVVLSADKQKQEIKDIVSSLDSEFSEDRTELNFCCGANEIGHIVLNEDVDFNIMELIEEWREDNPTLNSQFLTLKKVKDEYLKVLVELLETAPEQRGRRYYPTLFTLNLEEQGYAFEATKLAKKTSKRFNYQITETISGSTGNKIAIVLMTPKSK